MDSSSSTIDLNQNFNSSDFKLSAERGKRLVAPFEIESQNYECQCESCHKIKKRKQHFPKCCILGVICPLLWIYEIVLCFYLQWLVPHEPTHLPIDPDQVPTEYELEKQKKRSEVGIGPLTLQDIQITNQSVKCCGQFPYQSSELPEPEVAHRDEMYQEDKLKKAQLLFLRQIATQIVNYHHQKRLYLWKWIWCCLASMLSYGLVLTVILAATIKGYGNTLQS